MPNDYTPLGLVQAVDRELGKKETPAVFERLYFEKLSRPSHTRNPRIVTWQNAPGDPKYFQFKPAPGSLSIYWGKSGSPVMKQLEYGYLAHDIASIEEAAQSVVATFRDRELISLSSAMNELADAPAFFDVRYAGKTLAEALWAPAESCGTIVLPYNGGQLKTEDFTIVDYVKPGADTSLADVFLVLSPPVMTPMEIAAMSAVPADALEVNISGEKMMCTALVTAALFVAAVTVVTTCCERFFDRLNAVALPPDTLKNLGPTPSAAQLLSMRARIFAEFGVR